MLKLKKVSGTLLAAAMVLSSLGVAVSADSQIVVTDDGQGLGYSYTLYDNGVLDIDAFSSNSYGILRIRIGEIVNDYLDDIDTVNIDLSDYQDDSLYSVRINGAYCNASQINLTCDDYRKINLGVYDFPSVNGDEDSISLSDNLEFSEWDFEDVGLESFDFAVDASVERIHLYSCSDLESMSVPAGTDYLFISAGNLSEIDLSDCYDTIRSFSIDSCDKIDELDLTECSNLKSVYCSCCINLSDIKLPDSGCLTRLEYAAFFNCKSLRSINIPDSVKTISSSAFALSGLKSISLPEGIDSISYYEFKNCHDLESIYIPSSVEHIVGNAFVGCDSLKAVNYGGTEEEWNNLIVNVIPVIYDEEDDYDKPMSEVCKDLFGDATIYFNSTGVDGWRQTDKSWLYFDDSGFITTGWKQIDGTWYDFDSNGIMLTGWQESGNDWYYMNGSGAMVTGWIQSSDKWYFMDKSSGAMKTGWLNDGGTWYYFNGSGAMVTGWVEISDKWYYFESSGAMKTGWIQSGGDWYYLKPDGSMAAGEYVRGYWLNANGKWTYKPVAKWVKDSVGWYYIDDANWYVKSDSVMIDGKVYDFDSRGYCTNP